MALRAIITKDQRNYRSTKHHPGMLHQDGNCLMTSVGLKIVEWQVGRHRLLLFHTLFSPNFVVLFRFLRDKFCRLRTGLDIWSWGQCKKNGSPGSTILNKHASSQKNCYTCEDVWGWHLRLSGQLFFPEKEVKNSSFINTALDLYGYTKYRFKYMMLLWNMKLCSKKKEYIYV